MLDLFAGAGGLSLGFSQAGFNVLAGSDSDPDAMATFALNFPAAKTIVGDIRNTGIQRRIIEAGKGADVVVGGPPCQAFSQVRNHSRLIDDPRNSLYREFVRVVGKIEPRAFVMENVQGMAQMGVKEQVLQDLAQGGKYRVRPHLLDAADFGVPQTRKRLIFVGLHRDCDREPPEIVGSGASLALSLVNNSGDETGYHPRIRNTAAEQILDRLHDPYDLGMVSAAQAISDLSFLAAGHREDKMDTQSFPPASSAYQKLMRTATTVMNLSVPKMNKDTKLRLDGIPPGGNYRDLPDNLKARYLTGQKWGPSTGSELLARKHYYAYRRLHPDLWAWTLNTKADAVYHYADSRALSVREFCRLQSFPDDFAVTTDPRKGEVPGRVPNGATHSRYRQVGNAVPPLLAQAIARSLSECLPAQSQLPV